MGNIMTFGSLFAGIGGMDLGLERAGMECRWQVEIDPFCRMVLAKHWPDVPRHDDVRTFPDGDPGRYRVDLIAGGFPCQDVSYANPNRKGLDGKRSGLWSEIVRTIRLLRPRFLLVENVAALLDSGLGRVLGDLAESGFDAEWDVLPASAFGAPHERERVFLIAYSRGLAGGGRLVFHGEHDFPRDPQWRATQGIESGGGWKRWLVEACKDLDGNAPEPWFCGLDDGVSGSMGEDEFRVYGNAVVPQVAEWIGRRIIEAHERSIGG